MPSAESVEILAMGDCEEERLSRARCKRSQADAINMASAPRVRSCAALHSRRLNQVAICTASIARWLLDIVTRRPARSALRITKVSSASTHDGDGFDTQATAMRRAALSSQLFAIASEPARGSGSTSERSGACLIGRILLTCDIAAQSAAREARAPYRDPGIRRRCKCPNGQAANQCLQSKPGSAMSLILPARTFVEQA